ncbi:transposase, partial [Tepidibacter sp. Z1-5]|uniref:transposase n=1 Tax=Tepidibacter sp. Z1-5 TaxID=3134138 RepID=UPI0030BD097E
MLQIYLNLKIFIVNFSKKKNQSGYQLSAALAGKNAETVAMYLDSGNVHCSHRFKDLLNFSLEKYREQLKIGKLIIRGDSGYGTEEIIDMVSSISKLKFIIKGYSSKTAKNIAKTIDISDYAQADKSARVYEIPNTVRNRIIIVQILTKQGRFKYSHLITL